jgi:hypothetical protein
MSVGNMPPFRKNTNFEMPVFLNNWVARKLPKQ